MASSDDFEFARIYPKGSEARNAFDAVAANPALNSYHRSFIRVEAGKRSDDSESDQNTSERPSQPQREYLVGYYSLSLRDSVEKLAQGWRAGRGSSSHSGDASDEGNRGVDLLLICPGQSTNRVAPVHARIWLNPRSGVLMLTGVEKGRAVKYEVHDGQHPLSLENGQQHVLYQRCNNFWVGRLLYSLVFQNFDDRQYTRFVQARNKIFHNYGLEIPHPRISAVWRWQDTKLGNFILQESFGHGAFGWVSVAVDACTGEPRAIKTHRVKSREDAKAVASEIKVAQACKVGSFESALTTSKMLQVEHGLMPVYGDWCEHTPDCVCKIVPHLVYTASPLAKSDFSRLLRDRMNPRHIIDLFRGPLMGLVILHGNGYIHRDVTLKNLFVMSERPPRAVLGDFGKAVQAPCHRDRQIGPIKTLAPEVDGENLYDAKIDVWSMGIALMWVYSLSMRHIKMVPRDQSLCRQRWLAAAKIFQLTPTINEELHSARHVILKENAGGVDKEEAQRGRRPSGEHREAVLIPPDSDTLKANPNHRKYAASSRANATTPAIAAPPDGLPGSPYRTAILFRSDRGSLETAANCSG
ncbi:MAG: hypothetical protein LQ344_006687 [Seirophora lacunosa]|nr:MAG: hypothetical protein LQ344_006687 [Seirophora lacunosa]